MYDFKSAKFRELSLKSQAENSEALEFAFTNKRKKKKCWDASTFFFLNSKVWLHPLKINEVWINFSRCPQDPC